MSNGKGDRPRNNYSQAFRENHEAIDWGRKREPETSVFGSYKRCRCLRRSTICRGNCTDDEAVLQKEPEDFCKGAGL